MSLLKECTGPLDSGASQDAGFQKTSGHATTSGQDYEVALCCLVFLRALRLTSDFFLLSNHALAGKFDDVVLFYKLQGDLKYRAILVQAKHKETPTKKMLTLSNPFSLKKYLDSFTEIGDRWAQPVKVESQTIEVMEDSLVLFTNTSCIFDGIAHEVTASPDVKHLRDFLNTGGRLLRISGAQRLKLPQEFVSHLTLCTEQMSVDMADKYLEQELIEVLVLTSSAVAKVLKTKLQEGVRRWWSSRGQGRCLTAQSGEWKDVLEMQVARLNADTSLLKCQMNLNFTQVALGVVRSVVGHKQGWIRVSDEYQATATQVRLFQALGSTCLVLDARFLDGNWCEVAAVWGTVACPTLAVDLSTRSPEEFPKLLRSLQRYVCCHAGRQMVIIAQEKPPDAQWFVLVTEVTWSILDPATQDRLLSVKVNLQGHILPLRDVVSEDASSIMSDKAINALCDPVTGVTKLGVAMDSLNLENYVPQCLQRTTAGEINLDILRDSKTLIFTNNSFHSMIKNDRRYEVLHLSMLKTMNDITRETLVEGERADSQIRQECCRLRVRGVSEDVGLERKLTEFVPFTWLCEDKVVVVEGVAGVGKSTFTMAMCSSTKERFPESWVLRFDLAKHTGFIKERIFNEASEITAFLLRVLPIAQQSLQRDLLEHALYVTGNVFLFMDAFDEISPKYTAQCCRLLKGITSKIKFRQMIVTTRLITCKDVEEALGTKAFGLPVFSEDEQNLFLERYCKTKGKIVHESKISPLRQAAGPVLETPLLCRMAAEVLLCSENQILLKYKNPWRKVLLYEHFVEQTIINRLAEKLDLPACVLGEMLLESQSNEHLRNLQAMAVRKLMPVNQLSNIELSTKLPNEKLGLVVNDGESINFQHQTFAEYFLGCWLAQHWKQCHQELLSELLPQEGYEFVAATLSWLLFKDFPLHMAVARGDEVKQVFLGTTDRGGRSALHVAAMTQGIQYLAEDLLVAAGEDFHKQDIVLGVTAVRYAEIFRNWEFLEELIVKGKTLERLVFFTDQDVAKNVLIEAVEKDLTRLFQLILRLHQRIFHLKLTEEGDTVLHIAAANNSTEVLKNFINQCYDANVTNCNRVMPLHNSAAYGCKDNGVDLNSTNENGLTALMLAAGRGHLEIVKVLLQKGVDLNIKDTNGHTALMLAVVRGHLDIVKLLLEEVVDPNIHNETGNTVLMFAAFQGHLDIVKKLLEKGADLNDKNKGGETALMFAAGQGQLQVVKLLLEKGVDLNLQNENGDTVLMLVAILGHLEVLKVLLKKGIDLNIKDKDGYTALMKAIGRGNLETVKLLLEEGVDPKMQNENGETALMVAAGRGHMDLVKVFLEKGVDPNIKDKDGVTALMFAAVRGHLEIVRLLLEEEADINTMNKDCMTALMLAVCKDYLKVVKLLLEKEADLSIKDKNGTTALMLAAGQNNQEIVKVLLDKGVDPNVQNENGDTALILASVQGHIEVVKQLLDKEADVNIKNKDGIKALMFAAGQNHLEVVNILLEKEADINIKFKDGDTLLMRAASLSHLEVVKALVKKGVNLNMQNAHGNTVLMVAVGRGDLEVVKLLLGKGVDLNIKDKDGDTAFMIAASLGHMEIVNLLLEQGVNLNEKNDHGHNG